MKTMLVIAGALTCFVRDAADACTPTGQWQNAEFSGGFGYGSRLSYRYCVGNNSLTKSKCLTEVEYINNTDSNLHFDFQYKDGAKGELRTISNWPIAARKTTSFSIDSCDPKFGIKNVK